MNVLTPELAMGQSYEGSDALKADAPKPVVSDGLVHDLVKLFKLLSDETRLRILYYLTQRSELHVRALCELLDESQPAVSHHLALLRVAGLIDRRREGKHNFYGLKSRQVSTLLDMLFAMMPEHRSMLDEPALTNSQS
jgi:ArsR family transcriptional regulator